MAENALMCPRLWRITTIAGLERLRQQIFMYMRGHVAALLVQFARFHQWSNLHRVAIELPRYYAGMLLRAAVSGNRENLLSLAGARVRPRVSGIGYAIGGRKTRRHIDAGGCRSHGRRRASGFSRDSVLQHARYLREAIESAIQQDYRPLEILVIDDGSTDETKRISAAYTGVRYV
jgi:hypothetical protein